MNDWTTRTAGRVSLLALVASLVACGSNSAKPETPVAPPVGSAPAPAPNPAPDTAASANAPSPAPKYDVDFVEAKASPDPEVIPKVSIDIPGFDQVIPASLVAATKVRYKVTNFDKMPEGSYVQFIVDNVPYKPLTDLKTPLALNTLAPGGSLPEGEHLIAAFVCRKNGESIKNANAIAVRRFWTGKRTASSWDPSKSPLIVLGHPYGTYKVDGKTDPLVDWYVLNAKLGQKDYSIRAVLKGPGIRDEGIQRIITDWRTHIVLSAHDGDYTLQFDLLDGNGDPVPGPGNSSTRKFTVTH